jgi:hypothetical protein
MCEWNTTKILEIGGKPRAIDACIYPIVKALNDAGIITIASCCGHGKRPGNIALVDKRELIIASDYETGRIIDKAFPPIHRTT